MLMRKLIRGEAGNAMATALGVLSVTGVITASVFATTMHLSDSSNQSRDVKKALAAADAGLEAAVYRMNKQNLENTTSCFTTGLVPAVGGECPGYTESLGNGASYTYYVTPALLGDSSCAGVPISYTGSESVTITQRCVTSVGTVNGVQRRIQARVASYIGLQLFSLGILGLDKVHLHSGGALDTWMGSNGQVTFDSSSTVTGIELGPSAPNAVIGGSSSIGSIVRRSVSQGNHILAPVDIGNSATVNDNGRITSGQDASTNFVYEPAGRTLSTTGSASITLGGGTYNFCQLTTVNSTTINVAVGAKVRIFIDSPSREGSGCAAGTGSLVANNKLIINNPNAAEDLQIYVYGRAASGGTSTDVQFKNQVTLKNGFIYAPQSEIQFDNQAAIVGAIAAKEVEFNNGVDFTWTPSLADLKADTLAVFYKTAWRECRSRQPDPADPESGCTSS